MQFNKVNIPKLARNRYDYVDQGSGGSTTIISGGSGGTDSVSRLIEPIYSDDGEICGIRALYSMSVQGGVSIYTGGEDSGIPSVFDGLPIDNITLYWDNGVLKSKGSDGMDEGKLKTYLDTNAYINNANKANYLPAWVLAANKPAYTWSEIGNKPTWIGTDKPSYAWSEIGSKPSWIGANKPSYVWSEIGNKPSWIGDNRPVYTFAEISGKPTTLSGYGITDAVTLNTPQSISGAKNFTGGLSVNGCPIAYDTITQAWKLTGNLLVTGGITAYGDMLTGSAILDALPIDATLSKANGVLSVIGGGGFLSSITVKLGTVAYNSADGIVSLPAYPTTLPASDVSAWAKAAGKPSYTWSEIGSKPTTFAPSAHSHAISEITGLQGVLDAKASASHTHNYASMVKVGAASYGVVSNVISLPDYPTALKSPNALTISLNGASQGAYDGSAAKSFNINYSNVGAPSTTGANASGTWGIAITGNSATATKLQTARSINGTNFDGTSNITTALWGAARSFSIVSSNGSNASSAVNVNGSGNVSLYLPSTITASLSGNATTATALQTARTLWGQSFRGDGNVSGRFELNGSASSNFSMYDDGMINLQSYGGKLLTINKVGNNISFRGNVNSANLNFMGNSHYYINGDATLGMYAGSGIVGNETVCFQTAFDGQSPETSSYPYGYPQRTILALQPRGGRVAIGKTTADATLDVKGNTSAHGQAYPLVWNTIFNPLNSTYGDNEINLVSHNQYKPMIGWHDQISGQGYITKYNIGSYRTNNKWGQMVLAVSNNDYGNTRGAGIAINGDGTVTIEGNLLVTGAITQYASTTGGLGGIPSLLPNKIQFPSSGYNSIRDYRDSQLIATNNNALYLGGGDLDYTQIQSGSKTLNVNSNGYIDTNVTYLKFNDFAFQIKNVFGDIFVQDWDTSYNDVIRIGPYGISGQHYILKLGNNSRGEWTGNFYAQSYSNTSDIRYKNIISFIDYLSLSQIAAAPIFDFVWKTGIDRAPRSGTSAQYWKNVLPNTVSCIDDKYSLDYGSTSLVCNIVIARELQKLKQENEELRQEINKLKERAA